MEAEPLSLAIMETAVFGIDPLVGAHVDDQLEQTALQLGYRVVPRDVVEPAEAQVGIEGPVTPADLWRVTFLVSAERGVSARVWARDGSYVFELVVASLDGTGPFYGRGTAPAERLRATVAEALQNALGSPATWRSEDDVRGQRPAAGSAPQGAGGGALALGRAQPGRRPVQERFSEPIRARETQLDRFQARPPGSEAGDDAGAFRRFALALQTEGAIGTSDDSFYNHLVGVRGEYRFSQAIAAGIYVGYANLRGKNGRVGNLLMMAQIEDRIRILRNSSLTIPLRFGVGYIPFNGPVVRLSAGINIPLGDRFELGFDLLAPTFWVIPDGAAVSMNVAAELLWRL